MEIMILPTGAPQVPAHRACVKSTDKRWNRQSWPLPSEGTDETWETHRLEMGLRLKQFVVYARYWFHPVSVICLSHNYRGPKTMYLHEK